jgi:hypothetical protein
VTAKLDDGIGKVKIQSKDLNQTVSANVTSIEKAIKDTSSLSKLPDPKWASVAQKK